MSLDNFVGLTIILVSGLLIYSTLKSYTKKRISDFRLTRNLVGEILLFVYGMMLLFGSAKIIL